MRAGCPPDTAFARPSCVIDCQAAAIVGPHTAAHMTPATPRPYAAVVEPQAQAQLQQLFRDFNPPPMPPALVGALKAM